VRNSLQALIEDPLGSGQYRNAVASGEPLIRSLASKVTIQTWRRSVP